MLVCLKMLVIFLICGDEYVKVADLVPLLEGVGDLGNELFRCILSLNQVSRARGVLLLCAVCNISCHSLSCSLSSGSESILLMKNQYAAILCSREW